MAKGARFGRVRGLGGALVSCAGHARCMVWTMCASTSCVRCPVSIPRRYGTTVRRALLPLTQSSRPLADGDDGFRPEEGEKDLYGELYGDLSEAKPELPSAFSLEKQIQV